MADARVVNAFRRAISDLGASPKVQKALFEAGIVESHLTNPHYGDADSHGALQERASIYGLKHSLNPYATAVRFIKEAQAVEHKYHDAGALAQAVQRSAFPGRYDQHAAEASKYLRGGGSASGGTTTTTRTTPPHSHLEVDQAIIDELSRGGNPAKLSGRILNDLAYNPKYTTTVPGKTTTTRTSSKGGGSTAGLAKGTVTFDGKPVAAWIAKRLARARATGLWKGSVTSGERTPAQQLAAAKRFGLQHYGPKGPLGSNHVIGHGGAVDVSDPAGLNAALRKLGIKKLKSEMPDDPVHFSRTGY